MSEETERLERSLHIACQNLINMTERGAKLINALQAGMALQDAMLSEILKLQKLTNTPVPFQILAAKQNYDKTMKKLLEEVSFRPLMTPEGET